MLLATAIKVGILYWWKSLEALFSTSLSANCHQLYVININDVTLWCLQHNCHPVYHQNGDLLAGCYHFYIMMLYKSHILFFLHSKPTSKADILILHRIVNKTKWYTLYINYITNNETVLQNLIHRLDVDQKNRCGC